MATAKTRACQTQTSDRSDDFQIVDSCTVGLVRFLVFLGLLTTGPIAAAAEPTPSPLAYYQAKYDGARRRYQGQTNDVVAVWMLAQATFDLADYVAESRRREALALEGIRVCREALQTRTNCAPVHQFLALNLGQLARSRPLSALGIVRQMEVEFSSAAVLDAGFDHAGPDRCLGLLYRQAPGWPASIGNRSKARLHLVRAVQLAPEYPENRLLLAESGVEWKDYALVHEQVEALRVGFPAARSAFTGPSWHIEWRDWDRRWTALLEDHDRMKERAER